MKTLDSEKTGYERFCTKRNLTKALNSLLGMIAGIKADGSIDLKEQVEITNWIKLHSALLPSQIFNDIIDLLHHALEDGRIDIEELYDIQWVCSKYLDAKGKYAEETQLLQELQGYMHGISANNVILKEELISLRAWLENYDFLAGSYPYDEVSSIITEVLKDGIITEDEQELLRAFFGEFIDATVSMNVSEKELNDIRASHSLVGICAVCPEIELKDRLFCFTGKSSHGTRYDIAKTIEQKGGKYKDSVSKETQYLIIGNENNACWAYNCFGRKVENAMNLRKQGVHITIVHENDFWDIINE